jgi:hypothetical protein
MPLITGIIPTTQPRPDPEVVPFECERCGAAIEVTLEWRRSMDAPYNGGSWVRDEVDDCHLEERLCESCTERRLSALEDARELCSHVPADWFDPANAGEHWDDDY